MKPSTAISTFRSCLFAVLVVACLAWATAAHAQAGPGGGPPLVVDCGRSGPLIDGQFADGHFPSISGYLGKVGPGDNTVIVNGTCIENPVISNGDNAHFVAGLGGAISGSVTIVDSPDGVYLSGLRFSGPGDGIRITRSKVFLNGCNVSGFPGNGVSIYASDVEVDSGTFNSNGANGFFVTGHSLLSFGTGPVTVQGNTQTGIWLGQSDFSTGGNIEISGTKNGPGVALLGGARAQFGNWVGQNIIENNQNGGISVRENSEVSLFSVSTNSNEVRCNGKFGIAAGFHSQVTLSGAIVHDNYGPGVDVYAGSQFDFFPGSINQIFKNGNNLSSSCQTPSVTTIDPNSAGVRVDGNSQVSLSGGSIYGNTGPGILALTNSSVDFVGINFGSNIGFTPPNTGGIIRCDFTSIMTSDLPQGQGIAQGVACIPSGHPPVTR